MMRLLTDPDLTILFVYLRTDLGQFPYMFSLDNVD
jgi:hypothetical protein